MNRPLIALGLALILGVVGWQITAKEATLGSGRLVLLELAPVDPRSLMQGDYMTLRYEISQRMEFSGETLPSDGVMVLVVGADRVGTFRRLADDTALAPDEVRLRFRVRDGRVRLGAESYFFEEGTADLYARARYGALRIEPDGDSVLVGLYDADHNPMGAAKIE